MKTIIYNSRDLTSLDKKVKEIHFARPLSKKLILSILKKCPELEKATMSGSTFKRMKKILEVMKKKEVEIKIEKVKGRPLGISLEKISDVVEMHKDFRSIREIARVTNVPKSTVHYLLKKSKKNKVKVGNKTVLLK